MCQSLKTWSKNILGTFFVVVLTGLFYLCGATVAYAETGTITIMHTNDMHGYYDYKQGSCIGLSPLKALVDGEDPDVLLDAGDTFHGQSFATVQQGESIARLMNLLGYDAMTPGNHDWSYGSAQLRTLDDTYGFSVLAANVVDKSGNPYFSDPSIVKEVTLEDGATLKVGVLGVIDESFHGSTAPANVEGVVFEDPSAYANAVAKTLKEQQGCDVVIALTHNKDPQIFAAGTSNIDAVIAGHEHVLMNETVENVEGVRIPVVEAGYYLKNAGVLTLNVEYGVAADASAENVVCVGSSETVLSPADAVNKSDADADALIATIKSEEAGVLDEPLGTSSQSYPYSWEDIRTSDQALGHMVTASYLDETKADIAFENAGGIRGGVPIGIVTAGDMLSISPYGNTLSTYRMRGLDVLGMIEHSLEISQRCNEVYDKQKQAIAEGQDPYQYQWPDNSGSVLVVGGVTLVIDRSQPEGSRVVSAQVDGEPLDPARTYTVAMSSYIPTLTTEYGQLSSMTLTGEWGTCEEALRKFVGKDNWESLVYPLSGTVTDAKPDSPSADDVRVNPDDEEKATILARTGDFQATGMALLVCALAAAMTAGCALRASSGARSARHR